MISQTRTYQELEYFEKDIVEILIEDFDRDTETALNIVNEYRIILDALNDGHESSYSFAKMFDEAYRAGTSGQSWFDNILDYLMESVHEIREFSDYITERGVPLTIWLEQMETINNKKFARFYVGESQPTHTVRWNTFYVSVDKTDVKVLDVIGNEILSLIEWRKLKAARGF